MLIRNILEESVQKFGEVKAVKWLNRKEVLEKSYSEMMKNVISTRKGLLAEGFEGKHIALIGTSSVEWIESYLGIITGCATAVPLDAALPCEELIDLINRSDSEALFLSPKHRPYLEAFLANCPKLQKVWMLQEEVEDLPSGVYSINELRDMGKSAAEDASCPDAAATSYTIPATNKAAARNLTSKFTMTDTGSTGFYEGCIGGKEGYTEASGSTLVCAAQRNGMTLISVVLKGASGQTAPDAASILNYGFDQFVTLSLGDSDFSIISGGDVVVPAGTGADSLTTEESQNGDQIDRTYLFNGTSVGSAVLEVVQSDDTASVQEGQQHMQAAKDYSDNHTEIPYFVIAGVFLLLLILLIWRIVKIVKS